jgi:hypothetical protein
MILGIRLLRIFQLNFICMFIFSLCCEFSINKKKARSKLPKKRRRVLPVEQPRRKRGNEIVAAAPPGHRRMNMPKPHPANAIFKDAFGGAKIGELTHLELLFERKLLSFHHRHKPDKKLFPASVII